MKKRLIYGLFTALLLGTEILIALFAHGPVRSYLGDVLVVILIYTLLRTISPERPKSRYILPSLILIFSFAVEFLQLWGFCDRLSITDKFLRTLIGTSFSVTDLLCYAVGIIPCFLYEIFIRKDGRVL